MDDNLPKDPPASPPGGPPPFGSEFDPHSNPIDPNNPYTQSNSHYHQVQSELASQRHRDTHGHFLSEHPGQNSTPQTNVSSLPSLIQTNPKQDTIDEDPPLIKVTNPVTYLKRWWKKVMANEGIDMGFKFRIKPVMAMMILGLVLSNGITAAATFSVVKFFFPNSSPILHRQVVNQGTIQKGANGQYYLSLSDSSLWKLKPKNSNTNLANLAGKQVMLTGNLTSEKNLIEVSEVIVFNNQSEYNLQPPKINPVVYPNPSPTSSDLADLPTLYSSLDWQTTQTKTLIFTSGKRKIEEQGVYLESAQVTNFPQDFINYYINALKAKNFKQTLNSIDPDGVTITYAKGDLFLTFGVKNVYKGSGDKKTISGFKAYIEHN